VSIQIRYEKCVQVNGAVNTGLRTAEGLSVATCSLEIWAILCRGPGGTKACARTAGPKSRDLETDASRLNGRYHGAWGFIRVFCPLPGRGIANREGHSAARICEAFLFAGSDAYKKQGGKFVDRALARLIMLFGKGDILVLCTNPKCPNKEAKIAMLRQLRFAQA
jgi:hypothetical protein